MRTQLFCRIKTFDLDHVCQEVSQGFVTSMALFRFLACSSFVLVLCRGHGLMIWDPLLRVSSGLGLFCVGGFLSPFELFWSFSWVRAMSGRCCVFSLNAGPMANDCI